MRQGEREGKGVVRNTVVPDYRGRTPCSGQNMYALNYTSYANLPDSSGRTLCNGQVMSAN